MERAFITKEPDPTPTVSVVDVANGREIETFTLSGEVEPIGGQPINYVADSGAWAGETVIAGVTGGLAVFGVRGTRSCSKVLGVDPDAFPAGADGAEERRNGSLRRRHGGADAETSRPSPGRRSWSATSSSSSVCSADRHPRSSLRAPYTTPAGPDTPSSLIYVDLCVAGLLTAWAVGGLPFDHLEGSTAQAWSAQEILRF